MIIKLSEVLLTGVEKTFKAEIGITEFDTGMEKYQITDAEPIEFIVSKEAKNKVHIEGKVSLCMEIPCSRCLEPVNTNIAFEFEKEAVFGADEEEESEDDLSYILEDHCIETDRMIYGEILLNIPMKVLCKNDCKGICHVCGNNLNIKDCGCDTFVPDPRMAAISDVFKQFGE